MANQLTRIGEVAGLSEKAAEFLNEYVRQGGGSVSRLARDMGIPARTARYWAAQPEWAAAVTAMTMHHLKQAAPECLQNLLTLARSAESEKVKLDATKFALTLAYNAAQELPMAPQREGKESLKEIQNQISDLSRQLGFDAKDITGKVEGIEIEDAKTE